MPAAPGPQEGAPAAAAAEGAQGQGLGSSRKSRSREPRPTCSPEAGSQGLSEEATADRAAGLSGDDADLAGCPELPLRLAVAALEPQGQPRGPRRGHEQEAVRAWQPPQQPCEAETPMVDAARSASLAAPRSCVLRPSDCYCAAGTGGGSRSASASASPGSRTLGTRRLWQGDHLRALREGPAAREEASRPLLRPLAGVRVLPRNWLAEEPGCNFDTLPLAVVVAATSRRRLAMPPEEGWSEWDGGGAEEEVPRSAHRRLEPSPGGGAFPVQYDAWSTDVLLASI